MESLRWTKQNFVSGNIVDNYLKGNRFLEDTNETQKRFFSCPSQIELPIHFLSCIKEWILPGTTILSDKWKTYNCLSAENYTHLTVNHSINIVDPDTDAHTQDIERTWQYLETRHERTVLNILSCKISF